ncbi:hypothetical protein [Burkholderia territorii]|uniref:hypothetical protein n=1 Tax=Burkholderia territorii TaxID=1503055 RepID=UPI0007575531|nr:hypothetical protein [Burkholderia territorii]KVG53492.1 hypothetical protein WS79_29355 [Burkholderia territorii]
MAFAQHHLGEHVVVKSVEKDINDNYLSQFAFFGDNIQSRIRIAPDLALTPILEKFELSLLPRAHIHPDARCARGLGYNNALFMATELVLLRDGEELALLAHLTSASSAKSMAAPVSTAGVVVPPVQNASPAATSVPVQPAPVHPATLQASGAAAAAGTQGDGK